MAYSAASDIASYSQTMFADAEFVARDNNLMTSLVMVFNDASGTAARSSSEYGTAIMNSIGEADDLSSQAFTPSVDSTLTPGEAGAQFFITDLRWETDKFAVMRDAPAELGMAAAQKVETDILGNFSSLTGGTVGAAGTAITWGHFFAMLSRLKAAQGIGPYAFVCHPYQWHVLGKAVGPGATVTNSPALQNSIVGNFYVGTVSGVNIYTTANISVDASDDAYCAMFDRRAIALDIRRAMRLEIERDASKRGTELNLSMLYAHGVWRPAYGIQGIFDAAAPSS